MAYPVPRLRSVSENVIRINHPELAEPQTFLTANVSAAGSALTVKSNLGFSNTDPQDNLLYEGYGIENAEIKRVNGAITAGTSLTSQAVTFAHAIDCPIFKTLFDQVEILGSSTATGSKTSIATVNINVSGNWSDYVVTGTTYSYYHARFYNSLATTPYYSGYSDAIAATGFDPKNVGFIRRNAFEALNESLGPKFTLQWVYDQIWLGELDIAKRLKRWSWLVKENYDAGNVTTGMRSVTLPTDIEDPDTNKSILGLRIGTGDDMTYVDKSEFNSIMEGTAYTTLADNIDSLDTSVTLTDSRDFPDSGSIVLSNGTSYSYTTNTRSSGVLSGFTAFTTTFTSGDVVWYNVSFGEPRRYTVVDGVAYFDVPPASTYNGRNIWLDYYLSPTKADSDGDSVSVNDPYAVQLWLEMQIKSKKANGDLKADDIAVKKYEQRVAFLVANELTGTKLRMVPNVAGVMSRSSRSWKR